MRNYPTKIIQILFIKLLLLILLQINVCKSSPLLSSYNYAAPYQVLIKLKLSLDTLNTNSLHICNGVIVHSSVILTTADCLHVKILNGTQNNSSYIIDPLMYMVYAGNPNGPINSQVIRSVRMIDIVPGFNSNTLENDLAVLKLNESLPLGYRSDIQWIMMDTQSQINQTCSSSFSNVPVSYTSSSLIKYPIIIEDQMICNRFGNYTLNKRQSDICSGYVLKPGVMCHVTNNDLRYTVDRGTPLVCHNKVIGLLSSIVAPTSGYNNNCSQLRVYSAYYTNLKSNLTWIYKKFDEENTAPIKPNNNNNNGNNISPQFVGSSTNAPMPGPIPVPVPVPVPVPGPGPITMSPSYTTTLAPKHKKNGANQLYSGYLMTTLFAILASLSLYL